MEPVPVHDDQGPSPKFHEPRDILDHAMTAAYVLTTRTQSRTSYTTSLDSTEADRTLTPAER